VLGLTGPVPRAHGNQVFSPDSINEKSHYGWFERGDATLVQPIYTFGKISESMRAARHGIEVEKSRREQKKTEIAQQVKEYYYGALLARELKELLNEVRDDLTKARDKAKQLLEKNSTEVEESDVYKLDAFNGEVGKYLGEAAKGERLALEALKVRMGMPPDAQLELADQRLVKSPEPLGNLQAYVARAREGRQEFKQVKEGLEARSALVEAARAGRYPDIFVGGMLSAAHASNRSTVNNPWVPDQFNHVWGGVALGVKWKLDFGITSAKIAEEQAQYDRLVSTKSFAQENIPLQVRKFYNEAVEAETGIKESREGYENSKKWAVTSIANFERV
jgi:outer membrane protein TolC